MMCEVYASKLTHSIQEKTKLLALLIRSFGLKALVPTRTNRPTYRVAG